MEKQKKKNPGALSGILAQIVGPSLLSHVRMRAVPRPAPSRGVGRDCSSLYECTHNKNA